MARPPRGAATRAAIPRAAIPLGLILALAPHARIDGAGAESPCGSLVETRREAVLRGMEYLEIFLEGEERRAALGTDAVSIFLELGENAADPEIARAAMVEARELAVPLARTYTGPRGLNDRDSLTGALSLLPDSRPLHLSKKLSVSLLSSVRARLAGGNPDEAYYGARIDPSRLDTLDGDSLFDLLIASYTVERARLAFPVLPAPALGFGEVLRFVLARPYTSFGSGEARAEDDFYLATHVGYVLTDYSRFRLDAASAPFLLPYLRAQASHVLAASDAEAASEIVDVLRQAGATDADPDVCRLTRFLLASQRPDGSWRREDAEDAYDEAHPTWVAIHALRDRTPMPDGAWPRHVRALSAPATPAALP